MVPNIHKTLPKTSKVLNCIVLTSYCSIKHPNMYTCRCQRVDFSHQNIHTRLLKQQQNVQNSNNVMLHKENTKWNKKHRTAIFDRSNIFFVGNYVIYIFWFTIQLLQPALQMCNIRHDCFKIYQSAPANNNHCKKIGSFSFNNKMSLSFHPCQTFPWKHTKSFGASQQMWRSLWFRALKCHIKNTVL